MNREEIVRECLNNQAEFYSNNRRLTQDQSTAGFIGAVLQQMAIEMAAANDLSAKFIESHEERIEPLFKIPEFDKEGALNNLQSSLEKPAMKHLRDFSVGDEVWVKVKVEGLEDKDGDIEVSLPRRNRARHTYLGGNVEVHQ